MKHLKRILAICLCLLLVCEVGGPAVPSLKGTIGVTAETLPKSWAEMSDSYDIEAKLDLLNKGTQTTNFSPMYALASFKDKNNWGYVWTDNTTEQIERWYNIGKTFQYPEEAMDPYELGKWFANYQGLLDLNLGNEPEGVQGILP